ncbi:hypothetical protein D3C77_349900 [compost metagenome]
MRTAGSDTTSTRRQRIDPRRATLTQALERVVNGQAIEQVATVGVEGRHHRRYTVIERLQVLDELVGGDTPAADLAIDVNLNDGLISLDLGLDSVPVLILDREHRRGLVVDAKRHQRFHDFSFSSVSSSMADKVL